MDHAILSVFEPDVSVGPCFLQAWRRVDPLDPERALLFAVLSEAIETFQKYAFSHSCKGQALFRDAEAWIWADDPHYLVSFKSICQLMGLDPAYFRRGLLEWRARNSQRTFKRKRKKTSLTEFGCRKKRAARPSVKRFRRPRFKGGWLT